MGIAVGHRIKDVTRWLGAAPGLPLARACSRRAWVVSAAALASVAIVTTSASAAKTAVPAHEAVLKSGDVGGGSAQEVSADPWLAAMPPSLLKAVGGRAAQSRLVSSGAPGLVIASRAAVFQSTKAAAHSLTALADSATTEVDALALGVSESEASKAVRVNWSEGTVVGQLVYLDPGGKNSAPLIEPLLKMLQARVRDFTPETAWDELVARVASEGERPDIATALEAFSLAVHRLPDIPKPTRPSGTPDLSTALEWISEVRDQLGPTELAAVEAGLLAFVHQAIRANRSAPAQQSTSASLRTNAAHDPHFTRIGNAICFPTPLQTPSCSSSDLETLEEAQQEFRTKLGMTGSPLPILYSPDGPPKDDGQSNTAGLSQETVAGLESDNPVVYARQGLSGLKNDLASPPSNPAACWIALLPPSENSQGQERRYLLAHEAFHCTVFQFLAGPVAFSLPKWVKEGTPTWAGCQFAPGAETPIGWANRYIETPERSLFAREYDGFGFFSLLESLGIEPWSVMAAVLTAGNLSAGGSSLLAYETAVVGHEEAVLDAWSSEYFREGTQRGGEWEAGSPCGPSQIVFGPNAAVTPTPLPVKIGGKATLKAEPFATSQYTLIPKAPIIHVSDKTGSLRVNGGGVDNPHVHDVYYCTEEEECKCENGEHSIYEPTQLPPDPPTDLAATGGPTGLEATVEGLEDECAEGPPKGKEEGKGEEKEPEGPYTSAVYKGTLSASTPTWIEGDKAGGSFRLTVKWTAIASTHYHERPYWHYTSLSGSVHYDNKGNLPPLEYPECNATLTPRPADEEAKIFSGSNPEGEYLFYTSFAGELPALAAAESSAEPESSCTVGGAELLLDFGVLDEAEEVLRGTPGGEELVRALKPELVEPAGTWAVPFDASFTSNLVSVPFTFSISSILEEHDIAPSDGPAQMARRKGRLGRGVHLHVRDGREVAG